MKTRLLLVDDHAVVRSGLRMLLGNEDDVEIIGEAGTAAEALASAADLKPDVILMDIGLPDKSGIEATRDIKAQFPQVAIVALTIHEDEEYFLRCWKPAHPATSQNALHRKNCCEPSVPLRMEKSIFTRVWQSYLYGIILSVSR